MTTDLNHPRLDQYFLDEAMELMQTIEQTLLNLLEEKNTERVHTLMRSAHTLKGSAASVGLESIRTIAHHLEDVFQALYPPELEIDPEMGSLLLDGYECLRAPLGAILSGLPYDEEEVLNKTATVFALLQNKLGDFFGREAPIPSSEELGFDVVGSIFSESVPQDLQQLERVIASQDSGQIAAAIASQADFFLNLGSSYSLPGLIEISRTTRAAIAAHPERVEAIALAALANFEQARQAILNGDRARGGEVSPELSQWLEISAPASAEIVIYPSEDPHSESSTDLEVSPSLLPIAEASSLAALPELPDLPPEVLDPSLSPVDRILQSIWSGDFETSLRSAKLPPAKKTTSKSDPTPSFADANQPSIRVAIQQLDLLGHTIGELLIQENQQNLQNDRAHQLTKQVMQEFVSCLQQLDRVRDWSDKNLLLPKNKRRARDFSNTFAREKIDSSEAKSQFDDLEMDAYSELHLLLQDLSEKAIQLGEKIETIEETLQQSRFRLGKRKQLLDQARENLLQVRMVPLATVLNRFPRMVQQMIASCGKPAELKLEGTEVLVDKAISEKLYDPLLHLIRNAYDHGLESPELRIRQGKPETGQILIRAERRGNRTIVAIQDDGNGLNWQKIRAKAIETNLLEPSEAANASEAQLVELLFKPGFSTTDKISELSGRGIGLDVVRNQLHALKGSISVNSQAGQGTNFIIQLPPSLTTARLLVCQCGGITHALLYEAIARVLLPQPEQIQRQQSLAGGELQAFLRVEEGSNRELIPILPLANLLDYQYPILFQNRSADVSPFPLEEKKQVAPLLILQTKERRICLQVDRILLEQELVIKSLGEKILLPSYVQGYSILGDGSLTLAIDPAELVARNWKENSTVNYASKALQSAAPRLALSAATREARVTSSPVAKAYSLSKGQGQTILCVDDSIVQRQSAVQILEKAGYQVLQAGNGQEAIVRLERHPDIELVLCDIEMPVLNGFEFLGYCRQDSRFSALPVIVYSTRSGQKHRQVALALGAKAYLTKPCSERELLETIARSIERSRTITTSVIS